MPGPTSEVLVGLRGTSRALRAAIVVFAALLVGMVAGSAPVRAATDPLGAGSLLTRLGPPSLTGVGMSAVAYSPDGRLVVVTDRAADTVTLSRVQPDGRLNRLHDPYATGDGPAAVAFSPDGRMVAVANELDGTVTMFFVSVEPLGDDDWITLVPSPAQPVGPGPVSLAFSPDGAYLAVAISGLREARLFSVTEGGALAHVPPSVPVSSDHVGTLKTVRFSSRGVLAVGVDYPGDVYYFYKLGPKGALKPSGMFYNFDATLCDAQFSPDGLKFAYSNCYPQYDYVTVVGISPEGEPSTGDPLARAYFYPAAVSALAWSPDGSLLATTTFNGRTLPYTPPPSGGVPGNSVSVFSVTDEGMTLVGTPMPTASGPSALAFAPGGRQLAVTESAGTSTYRVSARGRIMPLGAETPNHEGAPGHVAFSADGSLLATATSVLAVSPFGAPRQVAGGDTSNDQVSAVAFSPSGHLLVRADRGTDRVTLESVTATDGEHVIGVPQAVTDPGRVAFSADGTLLAVLDASGVSTFRVSADTGLTFVARRTWSGATPADLAFRPGGGALLTVSDGQARLIAIVVSANGTMDAARVSPIDAGSGPGTHLDDIAYNSSGTVLVGADGVNGGVAAFTVDGSGVPKALGAPTGAFSAPRQVASIPTTDDLFVVNTAGGLGVLEVGAGELQRLATRAGSAAELAVSPDGKWVAGASDGIAMWSLVAPWLEMEVTAGPAALSASDAAQLAFSADYPARFECRVDAGAYHLCASPWALSGLRDGAHVASIRARDLSGALQGDPVTWKWKSDVNGPVAPDLTAPAAGARNLPPTGQGFAWKATTDEVSTVDRYELWIDGQKVAELAAAGCGATCGVSASPLSDGAHSWTVRAYDALGHVTETDARSFSVDAAPPSAPGVADPGDDAFVGDGRPRLNWTASSDGGAGLAEYDVLVDGRPAVTGLPPTETGWTPATALAEGPHTWQVVAKDAVGNVARSAQRTLTVDLTAPVAALRLSPSRFVVPFQVTADASASTDRGGAVARYEFDLDGDGSYETISPGPRVEATFTTVGRHPVGVRVVDRVGHSAVAADAAVGEEVTAKGAKEASVTIDDGAEYTRDRIVSLTIEPPPHSGAVTMIVSNDGRPDQTLRRPVAQHVPNWSLTRGDGVRDRRIVYVVFYNAAGLQVGNGRVSDDILYDPFAPTVANAILRLKGPHDGTLTFRAKDRGSGLASWELRAGKRTVARRSRFSGAQKIALRRRVGKVSLILRDRAGNVTRTSVKVRRRP